MRLERNLRFAAASRALGREHFTGPAIAFFGVAASFAALRLVSEAFFSEKFLFTGGEGKFCSAVFADKGLVFEHSGDTPKK